jgi:hypothetical protein
MFVQYLTPASSQPYDITSGPGDTLWFTDTGSNALGVVQLGAPLTPPGAVTIKGSVFLDPNLNGTFVAGDALLAGETVYVDLKGDGTLDPGDPTAVTDAAGNYALTSPPGTYTVRVATYPGDVATGPNGGGYAVTLGIGSGSPIVNLGLTQGGSIAPLHASTAPFGAGNSSLYMAEVNGLYSIVLGRVPDNSGFAFWEGALAGGASVAQVASAFLHSAGYESNVIASYYQSFFGRTASLAEVSGWVAYMQQSGASLETVATLFLTNPYYNTLHASNADFIQSLYGNLLGRQASTQEIAAWQSFMVGPVTRADVVRLIIQAADTRAVQGDYEALFGRQADPAGLAAAVNALQSGFSLVDLDVMFIASNEFATRAAKTVTA